MQAQCGHRQKAVLVPHARAGSFRHTEHQRLARAIDIRVQNPYPGTVGCQRQCKIDRSGGLAHTALAGGHRDDITHHASAFQGFGLCRFHLPAETELDRLCTQLCEQRRQLVFQRVAHTLNGIAEFQRNLHDVSAHCHTHQLGDLRQNLARDRIGATTKNAINLVMQLVIHGTTPLITEGAHANRNAVR